VIDRYHPLTACSQHCVLPMPTAVTHRHLVIAQCPRVTVHCVFGHVCDVHRRGMGYSQIRTKPERGSILLYGCKCPLCHRFYPDSRLTCTLRHLLFLRPSYYVRCPELWLCGALENAILIDSSFSEKDLVGLC